MCVCVCVCVCNYVQVFHETFILKKKNHGLSLIQIGLGILYIYLPNRATLPQKIKKKFRNGSTVNDPTHKIVF